MGFLGWIKNGTKHTTGLQMPAFFPASRVTHESVSVAGDGVKTFKELIKDLRSLYDPTKINAWSVVTIGDIYLHSYNIDRTNGIYTFTGAVTNASGSRVERFTVSTNDSYCLYQRTIGTSLTDLSSNVVSSGTVISLYY